MPDVGQFYCSGPLFAQGRASKLIDCPNQFQVRLAMEFINLLFMAIIIFGRMGMQSERQARIYVIVGIENSICLRF